LLPLYTPEEPKEPEATPPFTGWLKTWLKSKYGNYDTRLAVTDLGDVGHFIARVVDDERTLGRYVFCWGDEVSQRTILKTVNELSPKIEFKHVSVWFNQYSSGNS